MYGDIVEIFENKLYLINLQLNALVIYAYLWIIWDCLVHDQAQ